VPSTAPNSIGICGNPGAIQLFSQAATSRTALGHPFTRPRNATTELSFVCDAISGLYKQGIDECRAIGVHVQDVSEALDWLARRD
jgi:hypothetical protein